MKYGLLLVICSTLLCSCITRERCLERFPPEKEVRVDSVYVEKDIPVDTLVIIEGDTVYITVDNPCDENGKLKKFKTSQYGSRAGMDIESDGNSIKARCRCEDEKRTIRLYERWRMATKNTFQKDIVKVPRKITFIEVFLIVSGCMGWVLLIIFSIIKIRSWLIKRAISAGINSM